MAFIKAHRKQLLLAGPLAVAVTALTVTACGGGSAAAPAQGSAPGQWTQAEVSQFTAAAGAGGSGSQELVHHRVLRAGHVIRERDGCRVGGPGIGP